MHCSAVGQLRASFGGANRIFGFRHGLSYADPFFHMPRELLLLRHAKAEGVADSGGDFARALARRGKQDAPKVGSWLYREGLVPNYVVSSPAERARQTAIKVCKSLDFSKKRIVWDDAIYAADCAGLLTVLRRCPATAATVMLVGHNPGLEDLLYYLAGDDLDEDAQKRLPTAALARLEMPNDWGDLSAGAAHLLSITRPKLL